MLWFSFLVKLLALPVSWICFNSFNLFWFQFALLDKLLEMSSLLSLLTDRRSGEIRLTNTGGRSLLHCNTNIMEYTSRRILKAINSTSYDQENEVRDHEFQIEFGYDHVSAREAYLAHAS